MIRNYQRSGGSGSVDLTPIYSSIQQIRNELNSIITLSRLTSVTTATANINSFTNSVTKNESDISKLSTGLDNCINYASYIEGQLNIYISQNDIRVNSLSSMITAGGGGGTGGAGIDSAARQSISEIISSMDTLNDNTLGINLLALGCESSLNSLSSLISNGSVTDSWLRSQFNAITFEVDNVTQNTVALNLSVLGLESTMNSVRDEVMSLRNNTSSLAQATNYIWSNLSSLSNGGFVLYDITAPGVYTNPIVYRPFQVNTTISGITADMVSIMTTHNIDHAMFSNCKFGSVWDIDGANDYVNCTINDLFISRRETQGATAYPAFRSNSIGILHGFQNIVSITAPNTINYISMTCQTFEMSVPLGEGSTTGSLMGLDVCVSFIPNFMQQGTENLGEVIIGRGYSINSCNIRGWYAEPISNFNPPQPHFTLRMKDLVIDHLSIHGNWENVSVTGLTVKGGCEIDDLQKTYSGVFSHNTFQYLRLNCSYSPITINACSIVEWDYYPRHMSSMEMHSHNTIKSLNIFAPNCMVGFSGGHIYNASIIGCERCAIYNASLNAVTLDVNYCYIYSNTFNQLNVSAISHSLDRNSGRGYTYNYNRNYTDESGDLLVPVSIMSNHINNVSINALFNIGEDLLDGTRWFVFKLNTCTYVEAMGDNATFYSNLMGYCNYHVNRDNIFAYNTCRIVKGANYGSMTFHDNMLCNDGISAGAIVFSSANTFNTMQKLQ